MAFLNNAPIQIVSGTMINFIGDNVSGNLPQTTLLNVPVSINVFGNNSNLMGKPDGFLNIQISGITYKIGYYT